MITKGDKVIFNDVYYTSERHKDIEYTVITEQKDVCGTMCVWLKELVGCYAIDGLNKVKQI